MAYIMLSILQIVLFIIYFIIERFKKIFMRRFVMTNIVVYHTIIISNILKKMANYIKLKVVKS